MNVRVNNVRHPTRQDDVRHDDPRRVDKHVLAHDRHGELPPAVPERLQRRVRGARREHHGAGRDVVPQHAPQQGVVGAEDDGPGGLEGLVAGHEERRVGEAVDGREEVVGGAQGAGEGERAGDAGQGRGGAGGDAEDAVGLVDGYAVACVDVLLGWRGW